MRISIMNFIWNILKSRIISYLITEEKTRKGRTDLYHNILWTIICIVYIIINDTIIVITIVIILLLVLKSKSKWNWTAPTSSWKPKARRASPPPLSPPGLQDCSRRQDSNVPQPLRLLSGCFEGGDEGAQVATTSDRKSSEGQFRRN